MDQEIFSLGLSVECVSLYLLCYGIAAAGLPVTEDAIKERWNSSAANLEQCLQTMLKRNILAGPSSGEYRVLPASEWIKA
jgi:hypothetical protein